MDYSAWIRRLIAFADDGRHGGRLRAEVEPPLGAVEVRKLADDLDCGLPPGLRGLLATGASSITLHTVGPAGEDRGSEVFCPAGELVAWREEALAQARESWLVEPDWPLDRAYWRHALPLLRYDDGDGIALWVHDPDDPNPAVVYLRHDEESFLLSRTFDEFLGEWEQLGYSPVGELVAYRNPSTGFLDSNTPAGRALRASLGW